MQTSGVIRTPLRTHLRLPPACFQRRHDRLPAKHQPQSLHFRCTSIYYAVDLIIDEMGDGKMDDLNGDGIITIDDARAILKYVNLLTANI